MKVIQASEIHDRLVDAISTASRVLRPGVYDMLKRGMEEESSPSAKEVLRQLVENADYACASGLPLCQDTGMAVFFVEMGEDVRIENGSLHDILNNATIEAYEKAYLRKSMCHPITRKNTGNNTPAIIHVDLVKGDSLTINFMAKGGGSENMSLCANVTPALGWKGIKEFVVRRMAEAGPNPCPPVVLGVGVGGSFDYAPVLAKKALFRPLGDANPDPEIAAMEQEILDAVNALGIGPMGLGGKTTCLAVKINMHPCHIASLPVAVNMQCHSVRRQEVRF